MQLNSDDLLSALEVRLSAFAICKIDAGWRLRVSPLPELVCHFVIRGDGILEVAGECTPVGHGTVIIVPKGTAKSIVGPGRVIHEVKAEECCTDRRDGLIEFKAGKGAGDLVLGCASLLASVGGGFGIFEHLRRPLAINVLFNDLMRANFGALLQELSEPRMASKAMADCLMKQVLISLLRKRLQDLEADNPMVQVLTDSRLFPAVSAILDRPEESHSVSSLSALAGMSRSSFALHFSERLGETPMEFVHKMRMRSAARLLRTTEIPIKRLASAVGYSSRSQFSRAFKEAYGADPSSFRSGGLEPEGRLAETVQLLWA